MELKETFFSDETGTFVTPAFTKAGVFLWIKIRILKNARGEITLKTKTGEAYPMHWVKEEDFFDIYGVSVKVSADFYYYFYVRTPEEKFFYSKAGILEEEEAKNHPFVFYPGFHVPEWACGTVIYQIFTDRFCNGNPENDVKTGEYYYFNRYTEKAEWGDPVSPVDVGRFYGGDLEGILKKKDYLKMLGVEAIYLNPIFVSPSNHKYDIQDYQHIDPHFTPLVKDEGRVLEPGETDNRLATLYKMRTVHPENLEKANAFFAEFMEKMHEAGIRIILDGVFNHCGSFHPWMNREKIYGKEEGFYPGAFEREDSPYHDYFSFSEGSSWPDNEAYSMWWNTKTLPKLCYEKSEKLQQEILEVAKKWLKKPYFIDGWRLDVAADIGETEEFNHLFHRKLREAIKEENPEALILAEHYGSPRPWLNGKEWDSVMNYDGFMDPVSYFLTGMEKHSEGYDSEKHGNGELFFETLKKSMEDFPGPALLSAMNELSNHDHSRFLTRTNRKTGNIKRSLPGDSEKDLSYATFREGVVMQFTLPGCPTVYYGDETGMTGWSDPDNRRPYPWGKENWELIYFHRALSLIHRKYSCLKTGSFYPLLAGEGLVVYGRFDEKNQVLVVINHSESERTLKVPVWKIGMKKAGSLLRLMETGEIGYNIGKKEVPYEEGLAEIRIPAWASGIYCAR